MQDQLQRRPSELQNPSSPYNDVISPHGSLNQISPLDRDSREILAAIRELQRNLDLSHEFSAVLAAIQEKDVKHTPVLVALQEQKTDINAHFDDLKEMVRQAQIRFIPGTIFGVRQDFGWRWFRHIESTDSDLPNFGSEHLNATNRWI